MINSVFSLIVLEVQNIATGWFKLDQLSAIQVRLALVRNRGLIGLAYFAELKIESKYLFFSIEP